MEQGAFVIQELTGDWPVYPGHPLVLATAIMRVFPTFADANNPTDHGWSAALADSRIPGAGDHVGAAMRTLELGSRGANADAMVAYATRYWEAGQAGGHIKNVDAGKTQAEKVEPHFRAMSEQWFKTAETSERKAALPRYKTPSFQKTYDAMLAAARDTSSELYHDGKPHRGAGHRTAFWDGYAGLAKSANVVPGTLSAVCYAAGKEFAKSSPGIVIEDAVWTPGVTRQGGSKV